MFILIGLAREAGLEPATDGLENHCSIQLSYSRAKKNPFKEFRYRMNFGLWRGNKDFEFQKYSLRNYS